jgi:hypothetical protein
VRPVYDDPGKPWYPRQPLPAPKRRLLARSAEVAREELREATVKVRAKQLAWLRVLVTGGALAFAWTMVVISAQQPSDYLVLGIAIGWFPIAIWFLPIWKERAG